jgi:hypothetical protein
MREEIIKQSRMASDAADRDRHERAGDPAAIAAAVRDALSGLTAVVDHFDVTADVNTQDLQLAVLGGTIRFIQRNPDSISSRSGN